MFTPQPRLLTRRAFLALWASSQCARTAPTPPPHGLVYQVTKGSQKHYLAGSLHRLHRQQLPLPWPYEIAFRAAHTIFFEVDPRETQSRASAERWQRSGRLRGRQTLRELLPPRTWALLLKSCEKRDYDEADFQRDAPWLVTHRLLDAEYALHGIETTLGMEHYFAYRARLAGKTMRGLERQQDILTAMTSGTLTEQIESLHQALQSLDLLKANYDALIRSWRSGDTAAMLSIMRPQGTSAAWERMVGARNDRWIPTLVAAMSASPHPLLVLAGLDHLPGKKGLTQGLEKNGFRITQLLA